MSKPTGALPAWINGVPAVRLPACVSLVTINPLAAGCYSVTCMTCLFCPTCLLHSPAEFERLAQRNLGANAGMDYAGLGALLRFIAGCSLQQLEAAHKGPASHAETARAAAAEAPTAEAPAAAPATGSSFGSPWYHTFCLQRAGLVLRELLAAQRHIDSGCLAAQEEQQQQLRHGRMTGGRRQLQPEIPEEAAPPHAEEVAANTACLARIEQRLQALRIPL